MLFESHAHYDDERFDKDREELLESLPSSGISAVINAGIDLRSSEYGVALAERYDFMYAAVGIHPHEVKNADESALAELEELAKFGKVVAIGEIGLDYYYENSPRNLQRYWFKKQLELAEKLDLPVIIHSREAAAECYNIIKSSNVRKGVIHCYSGSLEMANDYIKLGFYIGIGGVVTYKKSKVLKEISAKIPIERILLETDCPYLSPEPVRGSRNDSRNLRFVADKISEIRGINPDELEKITAKNGKTLFFS